MTQTRFIVSQSLVKDVYNLNSPHGPMIVWESLYPEDKGKPCRFFVTVNEGMRKSIEDAFGYDGFFFSHGHTKAECIKEVKELHRRSMATIDERCTLQGVVDPTLKGIRLEEWKKVSSKYRQTHGVPR